MNNKKNVLVTGASKGIGKAIASILVNEGYQVYICARHEDVLKQTAQDIGAKGYFVCDLSNDSAFKSLTENNFDILINNAGAYVYASVENTRDEDIKTLIKLNIETPYKLIKSVIPYMKQKKWGRIVNIGSISGVVGEANASLYSMTKSAFTGLTKSLALELAQYNITINTVNPGWVETELASDAVNNSDFSYEEELDMIPQRRFIQPEEIANLVKYIISEDAKGMTGQNISLCAGLSVG